MTADWEWLSVATMAKAMGISVQTLHERADNNGWLSPDQRWTENNLLGLWRPRRGKGGGYEFHYSLLPSRARAALIREHREPSPEAARAEAKARLSSAEAWTRFEALPAARQDKARARLKVLLDVDALVRDGTGKEVAVQLICDPARIPTRTFYEWERRVHGVERPDWLPQLADHYAGRTATAEMSAEAWEAFKADWLCNEMPLAAESYRRIVDANKDRQLGWIIPSLKTVKRKIEREIDPSVIKLLREGREALDQSYPAQRRSRTHFHAMEALNYDGHKIDVFVKWEDGERTERAFLLAFQDLYSGMIVGWRLDRCENAYGFRLSFMDVVKTYGKPVKVYSDNTMAAAAKQNTAGSRWRNRFKIKTDDPIGLFAGLGVDIRFTKPAHGQSKPIERAFGDLSRYISKAPECRGAYTGNSPENKPANYGSTAVPIATLIKVVEREVHRFNTWTGRNGSTAQGQSYLDVFTKSYEQAHIRKASPAEIRMWLLSSEAVTCRKPDGHVELQKNRYWNERLVGLIGKKVVLRFDPDHLHQPVGVYRLDGSFICEAECHEDVGYDSMGAAKDHAAKKSRRNRAIKELAAAETDLAMAEWAALQPEPPTPVAPDARVVRPSFGNLALKPVEQPEDDAKPAQVINFDMEAFGRGIALLRQAKE